MAKIEQVNPRVSEVARLAGVALSTALRVLSGKSNVSASTTERVLNAYFKLSAGTSQHYAISPTRQKRMVTSARETPRQSDVARLANVGSATVSRALRGDGFVSQEKLRRILRAAHELNYVPDRAAQILRGSSTGIVGLIVPSFEAHFLRYIDVIENAVRLQAASLTLTRSHYNQGLILESARDLATRKADGLIVVHPAQAGSELLAGLRQSVVPTVLVSNSGSITLNAPEAVVNDEPEDGRALLEGTKGLAEPSVRLQESDAPSRAAAMLTDLLLARISK